MLQFTLKELSDSIKGSSLFKTLFNHFLIQPTFISITLILFCCAFKNLSSHSFKTFAFICFTSFRCLIRPFFLYSISNLFCYSCISFSIELSIHTFFYSFFYPVSLYSFLLSLSFHSLNIVFSFFFSFYSVLSIFFLLFFSFSLSVPLVSFLHLQLPPPFLFYSFFST
ncbi:SLC9A4 [Acanthosepion pharaonis]|uniref:SLC9A4 n=1 Tax=Acanthosepion pharaonis TaxID=158019 RepID=A0A812BED2_ACAPH|nr:SLC9A4 [Sepia pharaonis]